MILVHLQGPRKAKFDTQLFYVYAGQVKPGRKEIATASKTVHGIQSAWLKEQQVLVENTKLALYRVDLKVTFVLDRQRGQGEFRALRGEEGILYEAVEVVLIGSLAFAVTPQRSEIPTKTQLTSGTFQSYLSLPFLGLQYGAIAFT